MSFFYYNSSASQYVPSGVTGVLLSSYDTHFIFNFTKTNCFHISFQIKTTALSEFKEIARVTVQVELAI